MSGFFPFSSSSGTGPGTIGVPVVLPVAALTPAEVFLAPILTVGAQWIDLDYALTTPGAPAITDVAIHPQWAVTLATPGAGDWIDFDREEFNIAAAPTGDGTGTESPYELEFATPAVPAQRGATFRIRGRWFRASIRGDAGVANVDTIPTYLLRS